MCDVGRKGVAEIWGVCARKKHASPPPSQNQPKSCPCSFHSPLGCWRLAKKTKKQNGYFVLEIASKLDLLIQDESGLLTWLIVLAVVDLVKVLDLV